MRSGCHGVCWVPFPPDAFSLSSSTLPDIAAALSHREGLTVHSTEQKTWPLSHRPEAAGGCRVKGQYKAATISCSVNPSDSEMDSSIKSSRWSIHEYSLLETAHFKSN